MFFLFINKTIRLSNLKTRTAINAKMLGFVICVEAIVYLLLDILHDCTFKSKSVMSWSSRKKKEGIFCTVYFARRNFFNIRVLSQCIVYWIHFQNMHIFTYQKTLLHTLFCLFLKSCIFKSNKPIILEEFFINYWRSGSVTCL